MSEEAIENIPCVIVGDLIKDTVFTGQARSGMPRTKETFISSAPNQVVSTGFGGVAYLQEALKILFETHFPGIKEQNGAVNEAARGQGRTKYEQEIVNMFSEEKMAASIVSTNYWTAAKRPMHLTEPKALVYRVIDRPGRTDSKDNDHTPKLASIFKGVPKTSPDLIIISDHDRHIRYDPTWATIHKKWLSAPITSDGLPRRIVHLANRLPAALLKPNSDEALREHMWISLLENEKLKKGTMIVTSLDRLRLEGAAISKRHSWDATLIDFQKALINFPPLKKLSQFGHLVVRAGVVGAIHCYWKNGKLQTKFLYDPNANQLVFRDEILQGHAFGIRSLIPASIAFQIILAKGNLTPPLMGQPHGPILKGMHDAVALAQAIYTNGFGTTHEDVDKFVKDLKERFDHLRKSFAVAKQAQFEFLPSSPNRAQPSFLRKASWFAHIIRVPKIVNTSSSGKNWSIIKDNLSATIKQGELVNGINKLTPVISLKKRGTIMADYNHLKELRKIRLARSIVFYGVENTMNVHATPDTMLRKPTERRADYLYNVLRGELACDDSFRQITVAEVAGQDDYIRPCLLPGCTPGNIVESLKSDCNPKCSAGNCVNVYCRNSPAQNGVVSFAGPVAKFGDLKVIGRWDSEAFSSIRNFLSLQLSGAATKPLSLAVFGEPGSGKSFGITQLAQSLAKDRIAEYTCNLSQLSSKQDLDNEFFKIAEILLHGKTPLVFFDEFDSMVDGVSLGWLKYFLGPMNDGIYRLPMGVIDLKSSIFIFAGGTSTTYSDFLKKARAKNITNDVRKSEKVTDFISRLNGHIDIGGLNLDQDKKMPFLRRALILRSCIERDSSLVNEDGIAQIDKNIVDALLRVEKYRNGARSMASVLRMCRRWEKGIEKSSLPDKRQLNMHLDAGHFMELVSEPARNKVGSELGFIAARRVRNSKRSKQPNKPKRKVSP